MFGINKSLLLGGGALLAIAGASFIAYNHGKSTTADRYELKITEINNKHLEDELNYKLALNKLNMRLKDENAVLTEKIRVQYVDRVNSIVETKYQNRDVIKEVFLNSPYMTKGWVYTHDQLARNRPIDLAQAQNSELSKYTWLDSLDVIRENYSLAETARQKDEAWNNFYSGVRANFDRVQDDRDEAGDSESSSSPDGTRATLTGTENN